MYRTEDSLRMKQSPAPARQAITAIAFANAVLLGYEKYGADPMRVLAEAGIAPETLRDPNARISAWQFEVLVAGAMKELDDETLGWFGCRLPWGTYGLLCRASLTSPSLGLALRRWFRHHWLLTQDIQIALRMSSAGTAIVEIVEHASFGPMRELCLLTYLRFIHGYACWAVDSRIPLVRVTLPFDRPSHGNMYSLLFPGPVDFGAQCTSFEFESRYLRLAHQRDEQALQTMLRRPLPLTILQYRRDRLLVQRIRTMLSGAAGECADAEAIARQLNLSSRTMYRQLEEEGTSFQRIKNEIRKEQAIRLLSDRGRRVKSIASRLGFSSENSFARAFRQWTGMSPGQFRQGLGEPR